MSLSQFRGAVDWALMVALVFGAGAMAQAQDEQAQDDAKVIQIGPADSHHDVSELTGSEDGAAEHPALPKYWIGLLGEPVTAELRHHVVIPDGEGVVIREVVPDSPAAKAGIEQYDIVLRANDTALHDIRDLAGVVSSEGEKKAQITLEVLRHGERESVYVTPEERPAQFAQHGGDMGGFGGGMQGFEGFPEELRGLLGRGPQGGPAIDLRHFGPGVVVGGQGFGMAQMPNGVSISIQKNDGEPAHITVQRGDEKWEVAGDHPESLQQLPEELRPFVAQMLKGGNGNDFNIELPEFGPQHGFNGERLQKRLEEMEQRLQEMQQRLLQPKPEAQEHADDEADA